MSSTHKYGEVHAKAWVELGFSELRNAASFEQANVTAEIRQLYDDRLNQGSEPSPSPSTEQAPTLEHGQEL